MTNAAWHIASWDRARGRGSIECGGSILEFDGSAALVDDFEIGEAVHVHLVTHGSSFRVTKIWPDDPRVPNPDSPQPDVPALDARIEARISASLAQMRVFFEYRVDQLRDGDLFVHADDTFDYAPTAFVCFHGVDYIDLPFGWDGKTFRLANSRERTYLASRCELRADSAAIKIVDGELRAYFVVCADFSFKGG